MIVGRPQDADDKETIADASGDTCDGEKRIVWHVRDTSLLNLEVMAKERIRRLDEREDTNFFSTNLVFG